MLEDLGSSLIDGNFAVNSGASRELINPADERPFHAVADASVQEVEAAVKGAAGTWETGWRDLAPGARSEILHRLAGLIEANARQIAELDSRSMGKPIGAARDEVLMGARTFRYYAGALLMPQGETIPVARGG